MPDRVSTSKPRALRALATLVAVSFAAVPLEAQRAPASIAGTVRDSAGYGLASAEVRIRGTAARAQTNERGEYRLETVPAGDLVMEIRRFGFQAIELEIVTRAGEARNIDVELMLLPQVLDTVTVSTADEPLISPLAEFEARRARYYGVFYTRQDIERRAPSRPSDILRSAPGVRVMATNSGSTTVVMGRSRCRPLYWLDGRVIPMFELDHLATSEIQAIEVYRGPAETPPELNRMNAGCGVIAIWTRSTAMDRIDAARAKKEAAEKQERKGSGS